MRERLPLPQKIQNAPQLILGLELYYSAFIDLNSTRSLGMVPGPIPWPVIKGYAETYEFSEEQTEDLFYFVRSMDKAYLEFAGGK